MCVCVFYGCMLDGVCMVLWVKQELCFELHRVSPGRAGPGQACLLVRTLHYRRDTGHTWGRNEAVNQQSAYVHRAVRAQ